jgi:Tfp pilus assembly protein PilF
MNRKIKLHIGVVAGLFAGLLLAGAAGCSMTHQQRKMKAEEHWGQVRAKVKLQMARQQFERGHTDDALDFLDEALTWDKQNPEAYLLLARCRMEQGKLSAAERAIKRAVRFGPHDDPRIAATRGMLAERRENLAEAIGFYQEARAADDTEVSYLISEAECLVAQSNPQAARALLEAEAANYDDDPSIHALLGEIALRAGDAVGAARAFQSVLATGEYNPVIAEEYALLAAGQGRHRDALTVFERLIEKQGEGNVAPSVLRAAGECMLALRQTEPAKRLLHRITRRDPDDAAAWVLLARAGIATRDAQTTRTAAEQLRRLVPRDPQTLIIDAYASLQEDRFATARKSLEAALELDGKDVLAHCMLGLVAERTDDLAAAREHYRAALALDPDCVWARSALARMGASTGQTRVTATESNDASAVHLAAGMEDIAPQP